MVSMKQTGRAGLQFMGDLQRYSSTTLYDAAKHDFYAHPDVAVLGDRPLGDRGRETLDEIVEASTIVAESIPAYRFNRLYQRMVAEEIYNRGIPAAEERRDFANQVFNDVFGPENGGTGGDLTLNPDLVAPDYYDGVEWHLMPGGWDGYDLSMLMFMGGVSEYIFKHGGYAAVDVDADIFGQRTAVINQLPKKNYCTIYEAGSGGTPTIGMLRQAFPNAEIVGSDLSASVQTSGHEIAKRLGLNVHLKQEDCRHTTEPDGYYEAVMVYAVFHEMPDDACMETLQEMFRIMAPGADVVISDPAPIRALTPYQAVMYDWETNNREEPHFGASIRRSLPNIMREIGFEAVEEYGVGNGNYPWITRGRKPAGDAP